MNIKRTRRTIVLFLVGLAIAAVVALRFAPVRGVQKQLSAIRAAGLPASPAELDGWYKAVPVKDNRALAITEVSIVDPPKGMDPFSNRFGSMKAGNPLSEEMLKTIAAYLTNNHTALQGLYDAALLPESRYPINLSQGINTLLPHLAHVKSSVQLLKLDAIQCSHLGDRDGAFRSLTTGFSVAASLRNEPILISDLVRIASVAITLTALERVLSEHQLNEQQLRGLSRCVADAEADGQPALFRAMAGERACGISAFELNFSQLDQLGGPSQQSGSGVVQVLGYQAYRASGLRERDFSLYLEMMEGFVDSTKGAFPDSLRNAQHVETQMDARFSQGLGRLALLSRMLLPALRKATIKEANVTARLRVTQVALAIERFRLDHNGALPDSLQDLTPKYLFKLPVDPFDGKELVYERLPSKGYRVLSPSATAEAKNASKQAEDVAISVSR